MEIHTSDNDTACSSIVACAVSDFSPSKAGKCLKALSDSIFVDNFHVLNSLIQPNNDLTCVLRASFMWFGQFLCQNNVISHEQLVGALNSYFTSRPQIGKLALQCGMLDIKEINSILSEQAQNSEPFGQVAIRLGLLSKEQVEILVGRQFYIESIWDHVVEQGFLTREEIDQWMIKYRSQLTREG
jgi:hypothetical protein